jgi:hypothetical protein
MSNTSSIFTVFSVVFGLLLFSIWSNIPANAQQSLASPPAASPSSTTISSELKARMCDPANPSLKVVNTTESRICGIPKSVKNTTTAAATPTTSVVSASQPAAAVAAPKHQKMTASNNSNTITSTVNQLPKQTGKTSVAGKGTTATLAPVKNVSNKSLLSSSQSSIAPQVSTMNKKQQQQQQQLLPTVGNVTAGQNHTFAATSTPVIPGQLTYLGYKGSSVTSDHISTSKDKHSSDTKPSRAEDSSTSTSSTSKDKHSSDTKPSRAEDSSTSTSSTSKDKHSSHIKSSDQNEDSSKSSSTIKNDILSAIVKGLNSEESYSSENSENSLFVDSLFSNGGSAASASSSAASDGSVASASSSAQVDVP